MVVLLVVYLWLHFVSHSYLYGSQDVHFDSGWHSPLVQLFCLPAPCCKDNGQRVHRRTIAAHIFTIAAHIFTNASHDYYTLPVCAAQQPNYPLRRNIENSSQVKFCPALALWPFTFLDSLVAYFRKSESASREKRMRLWPRSMGGGAWLLARSGRVSQTKEERYSYQHWVAGGGRVGSWPTRLSSISISREQGHQQNCVQRRSEEAEKGQDGNELTIGLSTKSDHVSREQCHFDHQPVLPTEMRANQETKRCQPHNWWHFLN